MDRLTFLAKLVESLAWPLGAIILVLLLREDIRKIAPWIKKLKAGPVEAEMFERKVEELKEAVAAESSPTSAPAPTATATPAPAQPPVETLTTKLPSSASKEFLFMLAEMHPRSAIVEAWLRVEAAARAVLAERLGDRTISPSNVARTLLTNGLITKDQEHLYGKLLRLRNTAAHLDDFKPSVESATDYIELADSLQSHLERLLQ